jgi:hypothetical protein
MNPQFPVPLNTNRLTEQEVKEMPEWFKTPLDFLNKLAQTIYYAQEIPTLEIFQKLNQTLDALLAYLRADGVDFALDDNPNWANPSTTAGATQNAIVRYQKRVIPLTDDETVNISAIFPTSKDGEYVIMRANDPRTFVRFQFKLGTPSDADVLEAENFRVGDVDTFINLIQSTNDILFKNRLGSALDFVVYRRDV